jgi:anti-sigma B factor antagonist
MVEDVAVIKPEGDLVGGSETDQLELQVRRLMDLNNMKLIIDLSKVSYLNSTALGVLVAVHTNYMRRKARLALCGIDKRIKNVFVITKLVMVFDIHASLEDALEAMGTKDQKEQE